MLTPSEIDLLRQDLKAALSVVGQDEIEDAHALLQTHGFPAADFEIFQHADRSPSFPSPITGAVIVVRRSNRIAKTYEAGNGSTWLMQLETDLKAGTFGSAS
jgi:hypothetical protein